MRSRRIRFSHGMRKQRSQGPRRRRGQPATASCLLPSPCCSHAPAARTRASRPRGVAARGSTAPPSSPPRRAPTPGPHPQKRARAQAALRRLSSHAQPRRKRPLTRLRRRAPRPEPRRRVARVSTGIRRRWSLGTATLLVSSTFSVAGHGPHSGMLGRFVIIQSQPAAQCSRGWYWTTMHQQQKFRSRCACCAPPMVA